MSRREEPQQESFEAYGEYHYEYQDDAERVKQVQKAYKRRKTHGFFKFLIFLCILSVGVVVLQETVFRLETVYVIGNEQKTPQQIVMTSGLVRGRNMLGIEEEEVAQAFAKDHTVIFKGMQKEYPGTIYLYIQERKVASSMLWLGMLYTLDTEGVVMEEKNSAVIPAGLPVVTGVNASSVHVGQQLATRNMRQVEAYQKIMYELQQQVCADQISEINLADPDNLYLVTSEGVTVRMGSAQDARAKIGAVRTTMAYLRQLGKTGGILDVTKPEDTKYMPED